MTQKVVGLIDMDAAKGDSDAAACDDLVGANHERLTQGVAKSLRDRQDVFCVADVFQQGNEFVAAKAGDDVSCPLAQTAPQATGGRCKELVSDQMAVAVVDDLETIQVHEDHCKQARFALQMIDRALQANRQCFAVRQTC